MLAAARLLPALGIASALAIGGYSCGRDHSRVEVHQSDCVTCHQPEYEMTTMPPHVGLFDPTCAQCHSTIAWVPAMPIDHPWFPLRNRHAEERCTACHTVGFRPGDTSPECVSCHQDDYDATTMPSHANFPTDCASCHTDAGWVPSSFAHDSFWVLDGAHTTVACASCHVGAPPVYAGTPRECDGCHHDDYLRSPYPGHQTFRTTCTDCHTTTAWTPAAGHPESRFPIQAGAHGGIECAQCHDAALGSPAAGMNTNCIGCHQHARATVDGQHRDVGDYPVGDPRPNFCLDCHPNGRN